MVKSENLLWYLLSMRFNHRGKVSGQTPPDHEPAKTPMPGLTNVTFMPPMPCRVENDTDPVRNELIFNSGRKYP